MSKNVQQMPLQESISPSFTNLIRAGLRITVHNALPLVIHSSILTLLRQHRCDSVTHI